jgi:hypothetical protein
MLAHAADITARARTHLRTRWARRNAATDLVNDFVTGNIRVKRQSHACLSAQLLARRYCRVNVLEGKVNRVLAYPKGFR